MTPNLRSNRLSLPPPTSHVVVHNATVIFRIQPNQKTKNNNNTKGCRCTITEDFFDKGMEAMTLLLR